jgi:hypothetical protein
MDQSTDSSSDLGNNGPTPRLREMFGRFLTARPQSLSARTVELFGWYDLTLGILILVVPGFMTSLLGLTLNDQAEHYVRLVGLLVGGLGTLYVVSGRLNARGFVFASLVDRPLVPLVMGLLWYLEILPGALAVAFSLSDFAGFLWTLWAWREEMRPAQTHERASAKVAADVFGFTSGVVRNARTFHPDGRVFRGSVKSLNPSDPSLAKAADQLAGCSTLMRMGMGVMKRGMPAWLVKLVPDAPSIATRFFSSDHPNEVPLIRRPGQDLDLLCTAGGDRLWNLVLNLGTGGFFFGLHRYDYFRNIYYAEVPYRTGDLNLWLRLVPTDEARTLSGSPGDPLQREAGLTNAVQGHAPIHIEAQRAGSRREPFVPFAEIRFEEEIQLDQETLHFEPVAGRGFEPYGLLTEVRRSVYPASVHSRPGSVAEREAREHTGPFTRIARYLSESPSIPLEGGSTAMTETAKLAAQRSRRGWKIAALGALFLLVVLGVFLLLRFTRDQPIEYSDDEMHFKYGSTGGERTMGIPYWFWVALPELFPEYLPDKTPGRGYKSFGMIYEEGKDPRFDLPVGVSRRNFRGIDVVYLNCAVCHEGTVRDSSGAIPHVVSGMPAHQLNLGAFEGFLTAIGLDQKFTPQRFLDQIDSMSSNPHRLIDKPDLINRLIFKFYAVYVMREKMLMLRQRLSFIDAKTWGPGRVDTFNAPKALLNFPMNLADPRELMGNADFPSVWNQEPRKGMQLHWDGNNTSVDERNLSAAFGTGAYPPTLDADRVLRTAKWLETAKPMPYPYPIDQDLAAKGAPVYAEYCQRCHGTREAPFKTGKPDDLVGTVIPIEKIGTDRNRLDSYTYLVAANQSTLYAGYEADWGFKKPYPQRFSHFHKTQGYANAPLDGIWLRAPYLHNGSVPNLHELLEPWANRSKTFYRGDDVYDRDNVGFESKTAESGGTNFYLFDTSARGNGNQGHEGRAYGTDLSSADKRALLEYLKTF